jgi:hypothetical protein
LAVILEPGYTRCQVRLQNGVNAEGEPVYVSRTFTRIRPNATHEDIYEVIQAVLGLQTLPVITLRRLDDGELVSE